MPTDKRNLLILLSVLLCFLFCSCGTEQGETDMNPDHHDRPKTSISVTFLNNVDDADIWILPRTEDNLKTSLWGTPTISKLRIGEQKSCAVNSEGTGRYIIRIIDSNHAYYAAGDVILDDGYMIRFQSDETKYEATIAISDKDGKAVSSYENVFQGTLGAN